MQEERLQNHTSKKGRNCFYRKKWKNSYYHLLKNAKDAGLPVTILLYF